MSQLRASGAAGMLICPSAPWAPWWHLLRSGICWALDVAGVVALATLRTLYPARPSKQSIPAVTGYLPSGSAAGPEGPSREETRSLEALRGRASPHAGRAPLGAASCWTLRRCA